MNDREALRAVLTLLTERVELVCAELEGMERLAMQLGAISVQLQAAKDWAHENEELRNRIHAQYLGMWEAIEQLGTDVLVQDLLDKLPPNGRPN